MSVNNGSSSAGSKGADMDNTDFKLYDPIGDALYKMKCYGNPDPVLKYADFSSLTAQPGHKDAPLYVCPNGDIYLEAYSPFYKKAKEFLQQVAEPKFRPQFIHKYSLNRQSIYSAVSVGMTGKGILKKLHILSKLKVPPSVENFVLKTAEACGKVQLALINGHLYVESESEEALITLLRETSGQIIEAARKVIGGERLTPEELIKWKEMSFNEEVQLNEKSLRELDLQVKGLKKERNIMQFDHDTMTEAETFILQLFQNKAVSSSDTKNGGGASTTVSSTASHNVDELAGLVLERFKSKQVPDLRAALQLLERTLEETGAGPRGLYEDVRQRLLVVQAEFNQGKKLHKRRVCFFEVSVDYVETIRSTALGMNFPLVEEYDFKNDKSETSPDLNIRLKSAVNVRPYQAAALTRMFGSNGRCRSGIIVLPCGAGKTLVGISACANIRKRTIVFCNNNETMNQWCRSFKTFTTVEESRLKQLKLEQNNDYNMIGYEVKTNEAIILFTTYAMFRIKHEARSQVMRNLMNQIAKVEWGLVVYDEVHMLPAKQSRLSVSSIRAHCKLGLSATLIREDHKETDLTYLLGPKLYDQNWQDLVAQGFLARVQPVSVICPLPPAFFNQFLVEGSGRSGHREVRNHIAHMNPIKYHAAEFLIDYHSNRGDKILIFFHSLRPMIMYAEKLKQKTGMTEDYPAIKGETKAATRHKWLSQFKAGTISVLLLSQVGDVGIDLPTANIVIEVDAQGQNKRQLAQRFGRILRPKAKSDGPQAYFYSLVSMDTNEIGNLSNRRDYLINQGFNFQVLTAQRLLSSTQLPQERNRAPNHPSLIKEGLLVGTYRPSAYITKEEQQKLLEQSMMAKDVFEENFIRPKKQRMSIEHREAHRALGYLGTGTNKYVWLILVLFS